MLVMQRLSFGVVDESSKIFHRRENVGVGHQNLGVFR